MLGEYFDTSSTVMLIASFGASCSLIFGAPDLPVSQPRNVILGHFIAGLTGVAVHHLIAVPFEVWMAIPVGVSASVVLMQATRTFHPPAAANSVVFLMGTPALQELGSFP